MIWWGDRTVGAQRMKWSFPSVVRTGFTEEVIVIAYIFYNFNMTFHRNCIQLQEVNTIDIWHHTLSQCSVLFAHSWSVWFRNGTIPDFRDISGGLVWSLTHYRSISIIPIILFQQWLVQEYTYLPNWFDSNESQDFDGCLFPWNYWQKEVSHEVSGTIIGSLRINPTSRRLNQEVERNKYLMVLFEFLD